MGSLFSPLKKVTLDKLRGANERLTAELESKERAEEAKGDKEGDKEGGAGVALSEAALQELLRALPPDAAAIVTITPRSCIRP